MPLAKVALASSRPGSFAGAVRRWMFHFPLGYSPQTRQTAWRFDSVELPVEVLQQDQPRREVDLHRLAAAFSESTRLVPSAERS
jgi:hypothetical protein